MKCSVVIPTYNRVELLRHTLNSLVWQSLPKEQFEVLVADDGSDDSTAELVESFRGRLNLRYFFQERDGFQVAKARNLGISHADGEVCVMLDCGVLAHSDLLRAHLDSHEAADVPLAVCGYVYCFHVNNDFAKLMDQVIDYDDPDITIAKLKARKLWLDVRETFYGKYGDNIADLPAPWLNFWTCNVSARTEQLRAVGMFDEEFRRWGGEDLDLGYRLHRDGARFVLNRQAAAVHCPHEKDFDDNIVQVTENYKYMAEKYKTPIIELLLSVGDAVGNLDFFTLNDVIRERGLPQCADYLAEQETAAQGAPSASGR
ncbi:glycosyl transferase [Acrocarpospora pleiomorpha]|uniref:Glycosyl transferase n=1 Tax=Acrocarpospora pleiomorpha TaxID=90975 RepID=A0A5M3XAJ4_9ACTN|nr:glycosyl transferase [Acrocarpospora pleiomorpha]